MSEPRVIKKYPNRRLYDTVESRYITLADVRRLVLNRVDFVVIDKKTQADITHTILLQVISEQESHASPMLSRDFLAHVIRSHAEPSQGVHGVLSSYLEQAIRLFSAQQQEVRERIRHVTGPDALEAVAGFAERNYQRWRSVQDEIFRTLHGALTRSRPENGDSERRQDSSAHPDR